MNKHTQHFLVFTLARFIALPVGLLNSAMIGRILGANGFGQWTMIVAASTMIHNVFLNWTYGSGLRFGCEEWISDGTLSRTWAARLPLLMAGILIALFLLIVQPFNWLSVLFSVRGNLRWFVFVYAMSLWVTYELQTVLQATGQMSLLAFFPPLLALFSAAFLIILFLLPYQVHIPELVIAGQTTIAFALCFVILMRGRNTRLFFWHIPDKDDIMRHLRYGWPLLPTFLVGYITMWGNFSILQAYHSSREVGLFGAAYQSMLGIISLNSILITIVLPRLIAKNAESADATREFATNIIPTFFCLWALATIALLAVIPSVFIAIFGGQFVDSQAMLIVLLIVIPTSILPHAYTVLFNVQQRLGRQLFYSFLGMSLSLIVSLSLIPAMGGRGAAIGAAAALLVSQVCYMWDQHRFMNIPLRRMIALFSVTISLCALQYAVGLDFRARLVWGAGSILFLIYLFRKLNVVNANLLINIFAGRLSSVGTILKRLLIKT